MEFAKSILLNDFRARRTAIERSETEFTATPRRSVQIEPGLRPQSPENGNISKNCRRFSTISASDPSNEASGERWLNCKTPPLAGFSAIAGGQVLSGPTAWLATQC
jgi:hypothetical protein